MIKAVFFDIDGTLLSHRIGDVPASARAALLRLRERGVLVFAATGRHMLELERLPVRDLPFDGYVLLNGQLCLDAGGRLLDDAPVAQSDTARLADAFARREFPLMIVERERMYLNFADDTVLAAQRSISTPAAPVGVYTGAPAYQFVVYGSRDRAEALLRRLPHCKPSQWHPLAFDILPAQGGKAAGIRRLLRRLRLDRREIMAFGDGENDVEMLRYAGVGVAMGGAGEAVRRQADYVTAEVERDGVRQALEAYGLL